METLGRALKTESTSNQDIWWHKNETLFIGKWPLLKRSSIMDLWVWHLGQEIFHEHVNKYFICRNGPRYVARNPKVLNLGNAGGGEFWRRALVQVQLGPGRSSEDDRCAAAWCAAASCPR